jgi:PTS system nitrogen regulatory IIA component
VGRCDMLPITMASLVAPARVILGLRAQDARQVICEMSCIAATAASLDCADTREAVLARAGSSSFVFGRGVALPHAMVAGLRRPLAVFARLDPALDLNAPDDAPVDLALLILSAAGDEAVLLRSLACAARRLRDRDVASRLRSADGVEALHAVLTSDAWRGDAIDQDTLRGRAKQDEDLTNTAKWPTIEALC